MLLSLFCGAGGLDLGFERAGYEIGLAIDANQSCIETYNENRPSKEVGITADLQDLALERIYSLFPRGQKPNGVIGGPPCQGFSQANVNQKGEDARRKLSSLYTQLLKDLNKDDSLDFFVFENVVGLTQRRHMMSFNQIMQDFISAGFTVSVSIMNAQYFDVAQSRERLFLVGYNRNRFPDLRWQRPLPLGIPMKTVRNTIGDLDLPTFFKRGANPRTFNSHPNHWCMRPKSKRFSNPELLCRANAKRRSFKVLDWDKPSFTVAYGNREIHIHPNMTRR